MESPKFVRRHKWVPGGFFALEAGVLPLMELASICIPAILAGGSTVVCSKLGAGACFKTRAIKGLGLECAQTQAV